MRAVFFIPVLLLVAGCAHGAGGTTPPVLERPEATGKAIALSGVSYVYLGTGTSNKYGTAVYGGHDGTIYYSTSQYPGLSSVGNLGQYNPSTSTNTEIAGAGDVLALVQTPDNALWSAAWTSGASTPGNLIQMPTFNGSTVNKIPLPTVTNAPYASKPTYLAADSSGNLWYSDPINSRVGSIPVAGPYVTSSIATYPVTNSTGGAADVSFLDEARDGSIWFADGYAGGSVYHMTSPGQYTQYNVLGGGIGHSSSSSITGLCAGSDGNQYYMTNTSTSALQSLNPTTGVSSNALASAGTNTYGPLVCGNGTVMWLGANATGLGLYGTVNVYAIATQKFVALPLGPIDSVPANVPTPGSNEVTSAADGSVWFMCSKAAKQPLCLGHIVETTRWSVLPSNKITVALSPSYAHEALIGIAESADSGPFTASSSNTAVATVTGNVFSNDDQNFVIDGVATGTATITITDATAHAKLVTVTVH